jgi:hypothetical protein
MLLSYDSVIIACSCLLIRVQLHAVVYLVGFSWIQFSLHVSIASKFPTNEVYIASKYPTNKAILCCSLILQCHVC